MRRGKRHDYFTSALPWPQKGPGVELPLNGNAPVRTFANGTLFDGIVLPGTHNETGKDARLRFFNDGELRKIGTRTEAFQDSSLVQWFGGYDGVDYDTVADLSSVTRRVS